MPNAHTTLPQFLADERQRNANATPELCSVILDIELGCRAIAEAVIAGVRRGGAEALDAERGPRGAARAAATELFLRAIESNACVAGTWCEGMQGPVVGAGHDGNARYLVMFAALDQPLNLDINLPVGSIFSLLRAPNPKRVSGVDFLQTGAELVCAGYALYGTSTNLVFSASAGVQGFTLDPALGEFVLSHPNIRVPDTANEIAANASHSLRWDAGLRRYLNDCLAGETGVRGRQFDVRGFSSLVAEAHRIFVRGGVLLCPRDGKEPDVVVHLLHQANPMAFLVEQAGGRATTGRERVLNRVPHAVDQEVGLILGSREEVERIEQYHYDNNLSAAEAPLFGIRGLFRART